MSCILDEYEPYWCEADWNCKDCPNWVEDKRWKMGMSIDESKQILSDYQRLFNSLNGDYKLSQVQISELSHSIGTALDIMRKYQKIEQIYKEWFSDIGRTSADAYTRIGEVLKDGNDD